jgi:hypothetical protein
MQAGKADKQPPTQATGDTDDVLTNPFQNFTSGPLARCYPVKGSVFANRLTVWLRTSGYPVHRVSDTVSVTPNQEPKAPNPTVAVLLHGRVYPTHPKQ